MEIPDKIYLQYSGDGDPDIEIKQPDQSDITWSVEQVFTHDIAYIRQSSFQELEAENEKLKDILAQAIEAIRNAPFIGQEQCSQAGIASEIRNYIDSVEAEFDRLANK